MTTNYAGETGLQRERRKTMNQVRERLGDKMFANFMVDVLAKDGSTVRIGDLPALVDVWLLKERTLNSSVKSTLAPLEAPQAR